MSKHEKPYKKFLKFFLKVAFVFGLLYFLSQKGFLSVQNTKRAFSHQDLLIPGTLMLFSNIFLGAFRWQWLLEAQGIRIRMIRNLQLSFIGNFFNIALPGAVSGDFVKAFYLGKEVSGSRGRAFGAILFDRVAGLSALVLLAAGTVIFGHDHLSQTVIIGTKPFILAAAICVVVFYSYLFLVREHHDPALQLLRTLEKRFAKAGSLVRIYEGLRHYHNHRLTVLRVLAVSLVIHGLVGWACLQYGLALEEAQLTLLPIYVVVPLGLLITAVPVAPAGVGTGHAAFSYLFSLIGSSRGADIFTLMALANITFGALGGVVYLRFRAHEPKLTLPQEV
jgi:uncharacterized protein (TIRG00374 family)